MSGVRLTVAWDDSRASIALRDLQAAGLDMAPLMDSIGAALLGNTLDRFEQGRGPKGDAWKKSRRASQQGGQTLIDSARLRDSIVTEASAAEVTIGTNVIYAAIHQFGGTIRAKTAKGLAFSVPGFAAEGGGDHLVIVDSVTLPPRPYLGIGPEDEDSIDEAYELYIGQVLQGAVGQARSAS